MYVKGHLRWVKLISNEVNLLLCYGLKYIHGIVNFIIMLFIVYSNPLSHKIKGL